MRSPTNCIHRRQTQVFCAQISREGFASSTHKPAHQEGFISQALDPASSGNVTMNCQGLFPELVKPSTEPFQYAGFGGNY